MWHTSRGDRTLFGAESVLIGAAIDSMVDELSIHLDDCFEEDHPFRGHYGLVAYDSLTVSQRVGMLHDAARHLLTDTPSVLPLSAAAEAAVAAMFIEIKDSVTIEIDLSDDADSKNQLHLQRWRRMVLQAAQSVLLEAVEVFDRDEPSSIDDASSEIESSERGYQDHELSDAHFPDLDLPGPRCRDKTRWNKLIEQLADTILWDRDYELADCFLDADPGESSQRRRLLGIEDDYFTRVAPDPRPEELEDLVYRTRDIVRAKPR